MEIVCDRSEVRVEIAFDDEVISWKVVVTSTGTSVELFMAGPIELGSIPRVDTGRVEEALTVGIRDDEVISWKVVVTSTGTSVELFMAGPIELGSIPRVDTGRVEEALTVGIRDDVEGLLAEVDVSNTDEVLTRGTTEVEVFRIAC